MTRSTRPGGSSSKSRRLRNREIEVKTFHDDTSHDQSTNLSTIVAAHNRETRDLDVSVHFNAYDGNAHGTEVCWVTREELAGDLSAAIASAGGFTNRGPKYRSDLYFLNNTEMPAVLLEICFCDNTGDSNLYRENFDAICSAIATVLGGAESETAPPDPLSNPGEIEAKGNVLTVGRSDNGGRHVARSSVIIVLVIVAAVLLALGSEWM